MFLGFNFPVLILRQATDELIDANFYENEMILTVFFLGKRCVVYCIKIGKKVWKRVPGTQQKIGLENEGQTSEGLFCKIEFLG